MYVDSVIFVKNAKNIKRAVSLLLYYIVMNNTGTVNGKKSGNDARHLKTNLLFLLD